MSTLEEIESAIQGLSRDERATLARWWQATFDPDEGLDLRDEVAREPEAAQQEIAQGAVVNWHQLKQ